MAQLRRAQQRRRNLRRAAIAGVFVIIAVVAAYLTAGSGSSKKKTTTNSPTTTAAPASTTAAPNSSTTAAGSPPTAAPVPAGAKITGATPCPNPDGSSPHTTSFAQPPPSCLDPGKTYSATFDTTEGTIVVALDTKTTPITANNFVVLARYHYYDGSAIFRTDTSIDIVQGGGPSTQSPSDPGPGYTIKDEGAPPRHYQPGDLVMARTGSPNSAGAEYFFCAGPKCSGLDSQGTYVTFAHVSTGLDVVQKIEALNQDNGSGLGGAPSRVVIVKSVKIAES
ncbi:MAG: peptidylprolyl isomerase [Acidimicrobiales bacterium]